MRNMYATRVARGDSLTFLRKKGCQSEAMAASSGFKGSCDYCSNHGHKRPCVMNFCVSLTGDHYL